MKLLYIIESVTLTLKAKMNTNWILTSFQPPINIIDGYLYGEEEI